MSVTAINVTDFDSERLRIARDLHDVISYGFATISLQAGAAAQVADEKPQQAIEALDSIRLASKHALQELRGILGVLRHSDGGSAAAGIGLDQVESLVENTSRAGVPTRLDASGCHRPLPPGVSRAAYRIVQEALANVLRHAGEASASVSIAQEGDLLHIIVEDDGEGLHTDDEPESKGSGFGILGMRERALSLGGDLEAAPLPAGGFRVRAYLPVPTGS
jgi:signal transduction histidine kinase